MVQMSRKKTQHHTSSNAPGGGSSVPETQHGTQFLGQETNFHQWQYREAKQTTSRSNKRPSCASGTDGLRGRLQSERTRRIWANATCRSTACKAAPLTLVSSSKSLRARARRRETGTVLTQFSQRCMLCFRSKSRLVLTPRESGTGLLRTGAQEGVTRPP